MRIAMITRALPGHGGGGMERLTADLAAEWTRTGHQVTCVTTPLPPGGADELRESGVTVLELPGIPGRYSAAWRRAVRDSIDPRGFEVVLGVSSGASSLLGIDGGVPVVMQAHGTAIAEMVSKLRSPTPRALAGAVRNGMHVLEDWQHYPRYASLIAVGPGVARDLRWTPRRFRPRRVQVIVNGVPDVRPPVAVEAGTQEPGPVIAFVGRLRREKGPDLVIRALRERAGRAVIVGDGPERSRLMALARAEGVAERVRLTGALDRSGVAGVLMEADVVVLPSRRREGLPLVLLEAVRLGRRTVVSRQIAQSLPDAERLVTVLPSLTPTSLAGAVEAALEGPAPNPRAADAYSIETCARRYLDHFERLVAMSRTAT